MDRQLVDDLRDDLASGTALLVVGAGVSLQVTGRQPCASWEGLIRDGVEHCLRTKLLSNDQGQSLLANLSTEDVSKLLEIAQAISSALGAPEGGEFRRWLRHSVGALEIRDRNLLDAIHGLGVPIATTNYDDLLTHGRGLAASPGQMGLPLSKSSEGTVRA